MKRQSLKFFLFAALMAFNLPLFAQRFDSVLNLLDTKYPQEKLYLHFDRGMYSPGETIWFKAYLFSGIYPSLLSKTIYAELLDEQGNVLQRKTAPTILSGAAAAFDLPADLKAQTVYVRAYTRWMLNFDSSFLFVKAIPITSKTKTATAAAVSQGPAAYLQFFPEGGNLVAGLPSRVAFKATDSKGLPIPVKGDIMSSDGKKIVSFNSLHDGMGYFMLLPMQGEQYKATWKDQLGKLHETALPGFLPEGIVLKLESTGDKLNFSILKSPDAALQLVHVVAQMQQQLIYRAKATVAGKNEVSGSIPLTDVPAGIVQVTVFDEKEMPLTERLAFVNQDDYYFITDLNSALKGLNKRAKNVIQIDVPDTIACNLSVSVTDASLDPPRKNEDDIFSHILLTSDIRGYVHDPAYYFSGSDSAARYLDLVMMTNGWRRFRWEDALAGNYPVIKNQPEDYMAIEGKVSGLNRSSLQQQDITALMETKKSGRAFLSIPVKPDGTFRIDDAILYDTVRIYYQFSNDKDKLLTSRGVFEFRNNLLNNPLRTKPDIVIPFRPDSAVAVKNASVSQKRQEQEDAKRKVQTLATVVVKGKVKSKAEKMEDQYTSGLFSGQGSVFVVEDDPVAQVQMNVFNYLTGRVAGLRVSQSGGTVSLDWRGGPPALYLDEMQMDAGTLQNISMSDVAMIKVFNPPFFGGFGGGANGAIAVYTKKGSSAAQSVKGLDVARVMGYSPLKEFYSPDYSKADSVSGDTDYRATLYWNPFVFTNKQNRRILLTFYNNDITKRIRVVVEGINTEGKLTRIEKVFE
jgi:hypothetical protein